MKIVEYNFISESFFDLMEHESSFIESAQGNEKSIVTRYYLGLPYWSNGVIVNDWYLSVSIYYEQ
jgi:hypothetical protein